MNTSIKIDALYRRRENGDVGRVVALREIPRSVRVECVYSSEDLPAGTVSWMSLDDFEGKWDEVVPSNPRTLLPGPGTYIDDDTCMADVWALEEHEFGAVIEAILEHMQLALVERRPRMGVSFRYGVMPAAAAFEKFHQKKERDAGPS